MLDVYLFTEVDVTCLLDNVTSVKEIKSGLWQLS